MEAIIRPSAALRNNYSEISRTCREERTPVIITKNGIGDTVLMGLQEYNQMTAELELLPPPLLIMHCGYRQKFPVQVQLCPVQHLLLHQLTYVR